MFDDQSLIGRGRQRLIGALTSDNPVTRHTLGLCPLLAVSHKAVYGLILGLCTFAVLIVAGLISPLIARCLPNAVRLTVHMLVIGTLVMVIELLLAAYFYDLYLILGLFVPLIITNCAILAHCDKQLLRRADALESLRRGALTGTGFTVVLFSVAVLREFFGHGTLFDDVELFFGEGAQWMVIDFDVLFSGLPIALMPCGAFFALAAVTALFEAFRIRSTRAAQVQEMPLHYHSR